MNYKRREKIKKSAVILDKIIDELENISEDEQDSLDNIPDNFRESDKYSQMEDAADKIDDAIGLIEEAVSILEDVISA